MSFEIQSNLAEDNSEANHLGLQRQSLVDEVFSEGKSNSQPRLQPLDIERESAAIAGIFEATDTRDSQAYKLMEVAANRLSADLQQLSAEKGSELLAAIREKSTSDDNRAIARLILTHYNYWTKVFDTAVIVYGKSDITGRRDRLQYSEFSFVQPGNTLEKIARETAPEGSSEQQLNKYLDSIIRINKLKDAGDIRTGQVLRLKDG